MTVPPNYLDHLKTLSQEELNGEIDDKISETDSEILNSDEVNDAIAVTNAFGWGIDEYQVTVIAMGKEECIVKLTYSASGDQDQDKMYSGTCVTGEAEAVIDASGNVEYREITASVDHDDWAENEDE